MEESEMNRRYLTEILVRSGLLTQARLDAFVATLGRGNTQRLSAALVERGEVSDRALARALSQELSLPLVDLARADPTLSTRSLVPRDVADRFCLVPVYVRRESNKAPALFVATDDPTWEEALLTTSIFSGMAVRPLIAPRNEVRAAITRWYDGRSREERPTLPAGAMNECDFDELLALDARTAAG